MSAQVPGPALTLVFLEDAMVLTKRTFADWRAVQDRYPSYRTSLSPEPPSDLASYLSEEYPEMTEATGRSWREVIAGFLASGAEDLVLCAPEGWTCQ